MKNVTYNEPFFPGHFPNRPVMPAVLILEAMAQATGILALWCGFVLTPATLRQIPIWKDSYILWTYTLEHEPTFHIAFNNLGLGSVIFR